jgi:hypothetical protein
VGKEDSQFFPKRIREAKEDSNQPPQDCLSIGLVAKFETQAAVDIEFIVGLG